MDECDFMETEEGYLSGSKVSTMAQVYLTSAEAVGSEEWVRVVEWFSTTCALTGVD